MPIVTRLCASAGLSGMARWKAAAQKLDIAIPEVVESAGQHYNRQHVSYAGGCQAYRQRLAARLLRLPAIAEDGDSGYDSRTAHGYPLWDLGGFGL